MLSENVGILWSGKFPNGTDFISELIQQDSFLMERMGQYPEAVAFGVLPESGSTGVNYVFPNLSLITLANNFVTSIGPEGQLYRQVGPGASQALLGKTPGDDAHVAAFTVSTLYNEVSEVLATSYAKAAGIPDLRPRKEIQELNWAVTNTMRVFEQGFIETQMYEENRSVSDIRPHEVRKHLYDSYASISPEDLSAKLNEQYKAAGGYSNPLIDKEAPLETQLKQAEEAAQFFNTVMLEEFYGKAYPTFQNIEAQVVQTANGVELMFAPKSN